MRAATRPAAKLVYHGKFAEARAALPAIPEEQLAKTLVHERVHVEDLRGGMPYPSSYNAASAAETCVGRGYRQLVVGQRAVSQPGEGQEKFRRWAEAFD